LPGLYPEVEQDKGLRISRSEPGLLKVGSYRGEEKGKSLAEWARLFDERSERTLS